MKIEEKDEKQDTSKRRQASYKDNCSTLATLSSSSDEDFYVTDSLFSNDPAREVDSKFCRHEGMQNHGSSNSLLIRLDAVMTGSIIPFQAVLSDAYKYIGLNAIQFRVEV